MDAGHDVRHLRLDDGLEGVRCRREDLRPEIAGARQVELAAPAAAGEGVDHLLRHSGRDELRRDLRLHPVREQRSGDRQPDGPADLLEEREAARGDADPIGRHGVLDDQREDRERRPDPEPGESHPQPQGRAIRRGPEVREEQQRRRQQQERAEDQELVAPDPGDDLAGRDRAEDQSRQQGQDVVTRLRCARSDDGLEPAREEDDRGEEPEAGEEHRRHGDRERPQPEQAKRNDRVLGPRLDPDEDDAEDDADEHQAADGGVGPLAALLVRQPDEERRDRAGEDGSTEVVDVLPGLRVADRRQQAPQDEQRDQPERDVNVHSSGRC